MTATLILARTDIEVLLDYDALFAQIRRGFAARATSGREYRGHRYPITLPGAESDGAGMVLAPGLIPGIPAYTVKVNAKFPSHPPAIKGAVLLHSLEDGRLLALLDSGYLTAMRTSASGAVGAATLARQDASTVAIIGCGVQGRGQLTWMTKIRPITKAFLFDIDSAAASTLAKEAEHNHGLDCIICSSPQDAARHADIVITATWSNEPYLFAGDIRPGSHITTLGPDGPNEAELAREVLLESRFFADSSALQVEMGAIGGVGLGESAISAEIGEVVAGLKPGRQDDDDITVYGMVGLPFQDLAAAWLVYHAALDRGMGVEVGLNAPSR